MEEPAELLDDLRHCFRLGSPPAPPRIGAEVELIPVSADTGLQVPVEAPEGPATLPLLRRHGAERGWVESPSGFGPPVWEVPGAGILSYEPGGQIELSGAPFASAGSLLDALRGTVLPLRAFLREEGIELLSAGIEPRHPLSTVPLQLPGGRYRRLTDFVEAIGTGGARMMRQTASMQVAVELGPEPLLAWRVLNAMAPYALAVFASSPLYEGRVTGHRSFRAAVWRELDGGRTGVFPGERPLEEYLRFALDAPAILLDAPGEPRFRPFRAWLEGGGAGRPEWRAHLTTLFPEVRPRGFAELRSPDAVAPEWYAAPLVLAGGVVGHLPTLRAAAELLGPPDAGLLERAGRAGLGDPAIAAVARDLTTLALAGAAAQPALFPPPVVEEAAGYFARYTARGRSPADDVLDGALALCGPAPSGG
jgi:glutamate--cysteine ligase